MRERSTVEKFCPKCHESKPREAFGRDASRPDGRYTYCKECRKNPNRKDRVVLELAEKGLKVCTMCEKTKPFHAFDSDPTKSLGVSSRCKKCHIEAKRRRAVVKKELRLLEDSGYTQCYRCNDVKPLCSFLESKVLPNGHCRICLDCSTKEYYARAKVRDYTRWEVFEDDEFTCYICEDVLSIETPPNDPKSLSIDHVIPLSRGGIDERDNVRTCCLKCNNEKGSMLLEEYLLSVQLAS